MPDPTAVARLVELAESLGIEDHEVDDLVYDIIGADAADEANQVTDENSNAVIDEAFSHAPFINNGGFNSQFEFLLDSGMTEKEIEAKLHEIIRGRS